MVTQNWDENCCGCSACASVCAQHAIKMEPDSMGFVYPVVDASLCIECGLCKKICSFNSNYKTPLNYDKPLSYVVRHISIEELQTSRSGAVFIALSDYVLDMGGVVYGAMIDETFKVVHARAENIGQRNRFKGSKYAQSDMGHVFQMIKEDLRSQRYVLFSGTPCQTSGLLSMIAKPLKERLFVVDIVCHGVSSPFVWNDFVAYAKKKFNDTLIEVNFRDKEVFGWDGLHRESFKFKNKGKRTLQITYYQPFLIRESCHNCHFANLRRPSDITIGDYWGWRENASDMNADGNGCSLVLCNTPKGKEWFDSVSQNLVIKSIPLESAMQPNLISPTKEHPQRESFERDYSRYGFNYVLHHYWDSELMVYCKRLLYFLRRKMKRL